MVERGLARHNVENAFKGTIGIPRIPRDPIGSLRKPESLPKDLQKTSKELKIVFKGLIRLLMAL